MTPVIDDLPERMRDRVALVPCPVPDLPGPCWQWARGHNGKGYGQFSYKGKQWLTHRLSYELLDGPIPAGLQLDHLCRNPGCLNPQHLEPVTNLENALRGVRATKTHCIRNHPLSGDNLIIRKPHEPGRRRCRACYEAAVRAAGQRRTARKRAERQAARQAEAAS